MVNLFWFFVFVINGNLKNFFKKELSCVIFLFFNLFVFWIIFFMDFVKLIIWIFLGDKFVYLYKYLWVFRVFFFFR